MRGWAALLAVGLLAACDGDVEVDPNLDVETGAEPNIQHPVYDTDTLRWMREGRAVQFAGQSWVPVGAPIDAPLVKEVGEFEGTRLYTTSEQSPPYDRILIPTAEGWQIFRQALGGVGAGDTLGIDTLEPGDARPVRTIPPPDTLTR